MIYAGFWRRFLAWIIDVLILMIPSIILGLVFRHAESTGFILTLLYRPVFESSPLMGTPGKIFLGMQVTTEAGNRLTPLQALFRYLLSILSGLFLGLGYLFNLFTAKRQTFHDLMVGAVVVRREVSTDQPWVDIWVQQFKAIVGKQEKSSPSAEAPVTTEASPPPAFSRSRDETVAMIEKLYQLYQQGAISQSEFESKKAELLKEL